MSLNSEKTLYSSREVQAPVEVLYLAFSNPQYLSEWWGPSGFTNTIHEFDLRPGGKWLLTMHGPEKGNYENSSIFKTVIPNESVSWTRLSQPLFDMELVFKKITASTSSITFRMTFETSDACEKMKPFVLPKNEENFDRLEDLLKKIASQLT